MKHVMANGNVPIYEPVLLRHVFVEIQLVQLCLCAILGLPRFIIDGSYGIDFTPRPQGAGGFAANGNEL